MARTTIDQRLAPALLRALRLAYEELNAAGWTAWNEQFLEVIYQCQSSLEIEGLDEIRPIMRAMIGYDPLERDERPNGTKRTAPERAEPRELSPLQDLRRKIYTKAKAEPAWRFWGLYVHVTKMETLREAYRLAKANNGAPGSDGVTFEAIEEGGVEAFLEEIRNELAARTYRPMRNRKKEIPKSGGKVRILGIPSIRDRVVQGALKLILEPIFEADFQPGSYGYRPKRTAHQAVDRVATAIAERKLWVLDLDLRSYFDNVRHHILLNKIAERVKDDDIMRLLKLILKATGKKGVPQGGVISPLLSNVYLNEVDKMLEKAKRVTQKGPYRQLEYARYADDLVVLVNAHQRQRWILKAVNQRIREELGKLQVEVNEEKTRVVDLSKGESFGFLGFEFRRGKGRTGKWRPYYTPRPEKRKELLAKLKKIFHRYRAQSTTRIIVLINPILRGWVNYFRIGNSGQCFRYVRCWVELKVRRHMMRVRQRRGFGWKRWSTTRLHKELGLFEDYRVLHYPQRQKALASQ